MERISLLFSILLLIGFLSVNGCGDSDDEAKMERCSGEALCVGVLIPDESLVDFSSGVEGSAKKAAQDIIDAGGSIEIHVKAVGDCDDFDPPREAAGELIGIGVNAIVGHLCSGVSDSILEDVEGSRDIIMISPANTSTVFSSGEDKYKHYFRTSPSDVGQAKALAGLIDSSMPTYVIFRDDAYGDTFNEQLIDEGVSSEGVYMKYGLKEEGYISEIEEFLADKTAANIIMIAFNEGEDILKTLLNSDRISKENKYYFTGGFYSLASGLKDALDMLGGQDLAGDPDSENLAELFHSNSSGFYAATTYEYDYGNDMELTQAQDKFKQDYPYSFNAQTYDAVVLLALASLKADSTEPADLARELVNVSKKTNKEGRCISYESCARMDDIDYDGISGPIEFDANGDITKSAYKIFTYLNRMTNDTRVDNVTFGGL